MEEKRREKEANFQEVTAFIKEYFRGSILESAPNLDKLVPSTPSGSQPPQVESDTSSDNEEPQRGIGFDFATVC